MSDPSVLRLFSRHPQLTHTHTHIHTHIHTHTHKHAHTLYVEHPSPTSLFSSIPLFLFFFLSFVLSFFKVLCFLHLCRSSGLPSCCHYHPLLPALTLSLSPSFSLSV